MQISQEHRRFIRGTALIFLLQVVAFGSIILIFEQCAIFGHTVFIPDVNVCPSGVDSTTWIAFEMNEKPFQLCKRCWKIYPAPAVKVQCTRYTNLLLQGKWVQEGDVNVWGSNNTTNIVK